MRLRARLCIVAVIAAAILLVSAEARAQDYPVVITSPSTQPYYGYPAAITDFTFGLFVDYPPGVSKFDFCLGYLGSGSCDIGEVLDVPTETNDCPDYHFDCTVSFDGPNTVFFMNAVVYAEVTSYFVDGTQATESYVFLSQLPDNGYPGLANFWGELVGTSPIVFNYFGNNLPFNMELLLGSSPGAGDIYNSGMVLITSLDPNGNYTWTNTCACWYVSEVQPGYVGGDSLGMSLGFWFAGPGFENYPPSTPTISPTPNSQLTFNSTQFQWQVWLGAQAFELQVGTEPGGNDLYDSGQIWWDGATVPPLPPTGNTVYVTLTDYPNALSGDFNSRLVWKFQYQAPSSAPSITISPTPGSQLAVASNMFQWQTLPGSQTSELQVGSQAGGNDLYDSGKITGGSATIPPLPPDGANVYLTLTETLPDGNKGLVPVVWSFQYQEPGPYPGGTLLLPIPGATIAASGVTFEWSNIGTAETEFLLGTKGPGSSDLANTGYSRTVSSYTADSIPANGVTIYARVNYKTGNTFSHLDSIYTESGTVQPATITSPAPLRGSVLPSNVTFKWLGIGPVMYRLTLGTAGPGSTNLGDSRYTTNTSYTPPAIPQDGVNVYVRLFQEIDQVWRFTDYIYSEPGLVTPAALTTPSTNPLGTSDVTFQWTPGAGPTLYELRLGTSGPNSANIFSTVTAATSVTVPSIPSNGVTVYARFLQRISGIWQYIDYVYTESGSPTPAVLTSPAEGSVVGATNVEFQWSAGGGATLYEFRLGSDGPCTYNLFNSGGTRATQATVPTIPAKGAKVHACLLQLIDGKWQSTDSTYFESSPPGN